jgi:hypothetical protein
MLGNLDRKQFSSRQRPNEHKYSYSGSRLDAVHSDLSPNLSPNFDSYSPSLVGKGLGVRLFF